MADLKQIGRLAMRVEGQHWNAYYAMPGTMEGAVYLGSIAMAFVDGKPARRDAFMSLMKEAVADLIEQTTGTRPIWPNGEHPAPEHERAGSA